MLPAVSETVSYIIPALVSQDVLVSQDSRIKRQYQLATGQKDVKLVQLLGTNLWNNPQLEHRLQQPTGRLGEHMEGALFVDGMNWEQAGLRGQHFAEAFQECVGSNPAWESRVYDAVSLAAWALRQNTTSITTKDLRHQVQNNLAQDATGMVGMTGPISFDSDGNWTPSLNHFTIQEKAIQKHQK